MQEFPKLQINQVALMRADKNTGIVIDENFDFALRKDQKVYSVYNSYEEALTYANRISSERINVEIVIYDHNKEVIKFIE